MKKLTPDDLHTNEYELLAEVEHLKVKKFVLEQINFSSKLIRGYSAYQIVMILFFLLIIYKAFTLHNRGINNALESIGYALIFSFTILVILHELFHAAAYWLTGARKLRAGAIWKKFIFYVVADKQVINYSSFKLVAWAPFTVVKISCLIPGILFWNTNYAYFFFSVMCVHSLFCAGDIAMLAFYQNHSDKEIYNYDDISEGKTYFYFRK